MIIYMYGNFVAYSVCIRQVLIRLWEVVFISLSLSLAHRLLQV